MDICFINVKKQLTYGDLNIGDVFCISQALIRDSGPIAYMKFEGADCTNAAVSLKTGIAYNMENDRPVIKLNAKLELSDID